MLPDEEKAPERSACDLFENIDRTLHLRASGAAHRFFALRISRNRHLR